MRPAVRYDSGPFRFPTLLFALHFGRCDEPRPANNYHDRGLKIDKTFDNETASL